jgi:hypothetical protein
MTVPELLEMVHPALREILPTRELAAAANQVSWAAEWTAGRGNRHPLTGADPVRSDAMFEIRTNWVSFAGGNGVRGMGEQRTTPLLNTLSISRFHPSSPRPTPSAAGCIACAGEEITEAARASCADGADDRKSGASAPETSPWGCL